MGSFLAWLLESSLLVMMIFTIRRIFTGKISYAGIYALWLVVLLRFMIPVNFISTPFSAAKVCSGIFAAWEEGIVSGQDGTAGTAGDNIWQDSGYETDEAGRLSGKNIKKQQAKIKKNGNEMDPSRRRTDGKTYIGNKTTEQMRRMDWNLLLRCIWIAGSAVLFGWLLWSNVRMLRKMKRERVLYGQRGRVNIYAVGGIKTPCLYGFFHPAIYLPEALVSSEAGEGALAEDLEQMITHEFVHYIHRDHIWAMLRMLLVSVYWFDPFVWLSSACSKKDAELYCDETVIRLLGEEKRFSYGEMLVRLAGETSWADFRFSMMPMSRKGREMERRICAISEKRCYSKWVLMPLAVVLLASVSITCSAGITTLAGQGKQTGDAAGKTAAGMDKNSVASGTAVNAARVSTGQAAEKAVSGGLLSEMERQDMTTGTQGGSEEASANTSAFQEAFYKYIAIFTDAVNTGKTDRMYQVLDVNSEVYEQQCQLVKNYFKRGIREKVKSCAISSIKSEPSTGTSNSGDKVVKINSRERIKVFYADGSSRLVKQRYRYTCERIGESWVITDMDEIS